MYRTVEDFLQEWQEEAELTKSVIGAVTDEKKNQAIAEGHNTLSWLSWHLATTPAFFAGGVGLELHASADLANEPQSIKEIVETYEAVTAELAKQASTLSDEALGEQVDFLGAKVARGVVLRKLVNHQIHHRGQMTVLLRQAGLTVPGVYGPTKEQQLG